jgi:membrane protein YqaA with SNARE-associated domain
METAAAPSRGALTKATITGTILQVAMVVLGHWVEPIRNNFAIIGSLIGLATGFLFGKWSNRPARMGSASGGAIAASVSSFLGTVVSYGLGDILGNVIGIGTLSGLVTGLIGGAVGHRRVA